MTLTQCLKAIDKALAAGNATEHTHFHVGGYQVCQKWLKDRKGRQLTYDNLTHYQHIVSALNETIRLMFEIDARIEEHGGWPLRKTFAGPGNTA